ncbi:MAG: Na/Pi cotransporter family protein [Cryomorphaceae bacterium]|nr:Na/Pi cotransporter family protein [Cryomorphaceae bacterium]
MEFTFIQFLKLIGSVGLFIYGMKVLSDGIQKAAGSRFQTVINTMTTNRFYALLTGMFATFLVQSSSVTTVVVVSLANGGILNLMQSIGVILGANIGTTITAWLLTIAEFGGSDTSVFYFSLLLIGVVLLFAKSDRKVSYGEVFIGIALLFLGIRLMQQYAPDFQRIPRVLEFIKAYEFENVGFITRLGYISIFVLIGAVVALVVQSSTAALAITLVMTAKGWIPLPFAMAVVLGENIGTTATANIAALIGNLKAKRAAFAHFALNFFGVVWAVVFFDILLFFTVKTTVLFGGSNPLSHSGSIPLALSIFHTIFNLLNVAIFFFATPMLSKFVIKVFPSNSNMDTLEESFDAFSKTTVSAPLISIIRVKKEIHSMVKLGQRMFTHLPKMLMEGEINVTKSHLEKLKQMESNSDKMEVEILRFLSKVSENKMDAHLSEEIRSLMSSVNYLERSCDLMLKSGYNLFNQKDKKAYFTPEQRSNLLHMMKDIENALENLEEAWLLDKMDFSVFENCEKHINDTYFNLRKDYLKKIEKGKFSIQSGLFYMDILSELERMGDHIYSVAENMRKFIV